MQRYSCKIAHLELNNNHTLPFSLYLQRTFFSIPCFNFSLLKPNVLNFYTMFLQQYTGQVQIWLVFVVGFQSIP